MKKTLSVITVSVILLCCLFGCGKAPSGDVQKYNCTLTVDCITVLNNMEKLNENKKDVIPADGIILPETRVSFNDDETAYDILKRLCRENNIHMEASVSEAFNSTYIEGINNLYQSDCGDMSGWMYTVNGSSPDCGCDSYKLCEGDRVRFYYACTLEDYVF